MLRGWLWAPLPGPAPPAWEGAGAAGRGLSGALGARAARAAVTEAAAAAQEEGRGPRAAGLAGGARGPWAAAAAAGSPRSGLSAPLFVSAPGEGRVMSLLPGAGKQRRDKVTYPAPCPRPASPRSGGLRPGRSCRAGSAGRAPRLQAARPRTARRARAGLRRWLEMRRRSEEAAVGPGSPSPPLPHPAARPPPPLQPLPRARERGARRTHLGPRGAPAETPPRASRGPGPGPGRELLCSGHRQSSVSLQNLQKRSYHITRLPGSWPCAPGEMSGLTTTNVYPRVTYPLRDTAQVLVFPLGNHYQGT